MIDNPQIFLFFPAFPIRFTEPCIPWLLQAKFRQNIQEQLHLDPTHTMNMFAGGLRDGPGEVNYPRIFANASGFALRQIRQSHFFRRPPSAPANRLRRPLRGRPDWKKCWRIFWIKPSCVCVPIFCVRFPFLVGWVGGMDAEKIDADNADASPSDSRRFADFLSHPSRSPLNRMRKSSAANPFLGKQMAQKRDPERYTLLSPALIPDIGYISCR